jgi:spermidine synthase
VQKTLLYSIFFVAICGLIYELIAGTVASYLLGDSVTQFSTIIGTYLFAMGIGSHLSKYLTRGLLRSFVSIELLVGMVGGFSAAILFVLFDLVEHFRIPLYVLVMVTGILVGIEIPLVMRILKEKLPFKDLVAKVFTFDYIGALFASLLFPLVLAPKLGLIRTSFLFGIINVTVALWAIHVFREEFRGSRYYFRSGLLCLGVLVAGFIASDRILAWSESGIYAGNVIYAKNSKYQRIVLTRDANELRLFLNGNLQFSSRDEYRYHEALVHPLAAAQSERKRVLVLGGGDGFAVRELLKYPDVEKITLVDLDEKLTDLFTTQEVLTTLNNGALKSPKVQVINDDAFIWLRKNTGPDFTYDLIVIDFPDPSNFSLGKLYTTTFYQQVRNHLAEGGAFVVQSTSPVAARKSFWCVVETIEASGFVATPYHTYVPSFGEWGFIIGSSGEPAVNAAPYPEGLKFVSAETVRTMLHFPADMARTDAGINRLNNQVLVKHFESEWSEYAR